MPKGIALRMRFLDLQEEDRELLASLRPLFEASASRVVEDFYRHLLAFEETRELLADPSTQQRLLEVQRSYLLSLVPPALDEGYAQERLQIGQAHQRIGLAPRWFLGAHAHYFRLLAPLVQAHLRAEPERAERALLALHKLLALDAELVLESYLGSREERLEHMDRELSAMSSVLDVYRRQSDVLRDTAFRAQVAEERASVATMVAGLAHEIGTPMGVIQGHAELLESSITGDAGRERLRVIQEQIDRISGIMRNLLEMARPQERERSEVDVRELIQRCVAFVGDQLRRREIEVKLEWEQATLLGDEKRLQQVLLNLFVNAADAMPRGGELRIALEQVGESVEVRVADTGEGIPAAVVSRIFDPFFTTKEAGRGYGLGLTVTRDIVREHGGHIEVASRPGEGTEFRITLPAAREPATGC